MDYTSLSDAELLSLQRSGNVQGFNALFDRYWISLFNLAKRILDDEHLAQDVIQEAFTSLYENARNRNIDHVKAYLHQAVKYQCFMHLRSGKIQEKHLSRLNTVSTSNNVEEYIHAAELEVIILQQIDALPVKCREVFFLSRYELLPNKQIAEQLSISQKTVEHQLTKALKTLRLSVDKMALLVFLGNFFSKIFS